MGRRDNAEMGAGELGVSCRCRRAMGRLCARPLAGVVLAGIVGGVALTVLTRLTMPAIPETIGARLGYRALGWPAQLLAGTAFGAGFAWPARRFVAGWGTAIASGMGLGVLWWGLGSLLLLPRWLGSGSPSGVVAPESGLTALVCDLAYGLATAGTLLGCRALAGAPGRPRSLEVYVARHCLGCAEAHRLAAEAAGRFPALRVRVIDVDDVATGHGDAGGRLPEPLVAVPTYLLDGQVLSLGNPSPEALFARLELEARRGRPATAGATHPEGRAPGGVSG